MKLNRLILIAFFALALYIAYLLRRPVNTITFYNTTLKVITKSVKAWERLRYEVSYCKDSDYEANTTRVLINSPEDWKSRLLEQLVSNVPKTADKCNNETVSTTIAEVYMPEYIPVWNKQLILKVSYRINPLRTIVKQIETEPFYIQ